MVTVSVEQTSAWVRNFNPLLVPGVARWPSKHGIYEPLMIFNPLDGDGRFVPWLATDYQWSADLLTVQLALRPGVRWSDGASFSSADVIATFELLRAHPALDINGVWRVLATVEARGPLGVEFRFQRPNVPGFADVVHQVIVPAHVWSEVSDPLAFTNPNPIGTGPFTEVQGFRTQVYEVGRNPHYWGGDRGIDALRMPAYPSNDQAQLALIDGSLDWAATFIPQVDRTFVARNPEYNHYWFPTLGQSVLLYANTRRAPFDDPEVRRGLSMAIDRERLVRIAMESYTKPDDGTALSDAYESWKPSRWDRRWVTFDRAAATRALDRAGLRSSGGRRLGTDGAPLRVEIQVVSGWSDWVRASQLIARDLGEIGIEAKVRVHEFGAWSSNVQRGDFDLAIGWTLPGPTPYRTYRWLMSSETVAPLGAPTPGNWNRVGDPIADRLLAAFEATRDLDEQRALARSLQQRFVDLAPAIPLFPAPIWGAYSTRRAVGFPNAENPYARLGPAREPDRLLVLTRLTRRPR